MNENNQKTNQSKDALNTLKLPDKSGAPTDLTTNSTASHRSVNVGCGFSGQRSIYLTALSEFNILPKKARILLIR